MAKDEAKIPLPQALALIIGSVFLVSGGALLSMKLYRSHREGKLSDPRYEIQTIVQTGPVKEGVSTQYLAELLGLSSDQPTHMYAFDELAAQKKLESSPLIESAQVSKVMPAKLYIDYSMRTPVVKLADVSNLSMDLSSSLFPLHPFFRPRELPSVYLGLNELLGDAKLVNGCGNYQELIRRAPIESQEQLADALPLAMKVLDSGARIFKNTRIAIKWIDVSRAYLPSYGQREIVVIAEETLYDKSDSCTFAYRLRLNRDRYEKNFHQFFALRKELTRDHLQSFDRAKKGAQGPLRVEKTIDLRLDSYAYIQIE